MKVALSVSLIAFAAAFTFSPTYTSFGRLLRTRLVDSLDTGPQSFDSYEPSPLQDDLQSAPHYGGPPPFGSPPGNAVPVPLGDRGAHNEPPPFGASPTYGPPTIEIAPRQAPMDWAEPPPFGGPPTYGVVPTLGPPPDSDSFSPEPPPFGGPPAYATAGQASPPSAFGQPLGPPHSQSASVDEDEPPPFGGPPTYVSSGSGPPSSFGQPLGPPESGASVSSDEPPPFGGPPTYGAAQTMGPPLSGPPSAFGTPMGLSNSEPPTICEDPPPFGGPPTYGLEQPGPPSNFGEPLGPPRSEDQSTPEESFGDPRANAGQSSMEQPASRDTQNDTGPQPLEFTPIDNGLAYGDHSANGFPIVEPPPLDVTKITAVDNIQAPYGDVPGDHGHHPLEATPMNNEQAPFGDAPTDHGEQPLGAAEEPPLEATATNNGQAPFGDAPADHGEQPLGAAEELPLEVAAADDGQPPFGTNPADHGQQRLEGAAVHHEQPSLEATPANSELPASSELALGAFSAKDGRQALGGKDGQLLPATKEEVAAAEEKVVTAEEKVAAAKQEASVKKAEYLANTDTAVSGILRQSWASAEEDVKSAQAVLNAARRILVGEMGPGKGQPEEHLHLDIRLNDPQEQADVMKSALSEVLEEHLGKARTTPISLPTAQSGSTKKNARARKKFRIFQGEKQGAEAAKLTEHFKRIFSDSDFQVVNSEAFQWQDTGEDNQKNNKKLRDDAINPDLLP